MDEFFERHPELRGWFDEKLQEERENIRVLLDRQNELAQVMNSVANKYVKWSLAKDHFISEVVSYSSDITSKINTNELSIVDAIHSLDEEIASLRCQDEMIARKQLKQVVIVKPVLDPVIKNRTTKRQENISLIIAGVGFVSGALQFVAGVGLVETGVGAGMGGLLIGHGINNVVENGYYLLYRENYTGPVKFVYEQVGQNIFGLNTRDSDVIYTFVDMGISVNVLLGYRLEPDMSRLLRYVNADLLTGLKHPGFKMMSGMDLLLETTGAFNTGYGQARSY
ncbi:hypothetical protein Z042_10740 [Chania multitudinisentens RB-25]|uniref:DUF4225 domain-containing protein n=2 Tax=Chania TaxID=1745211 RepID=W0L8K0_9GAMM|nr:hypothetical protein Z042_10740 [Chania multitudinisentens RB-25]